MNQELLKEFESALKKEKQTLIEELESFAQPDRNVKGDWDAKYENIGDGWDNNAQEVTEYATRLPLEHELETRLQEIDLALERITKSTYGICEKCGTAIDIERLKAEPSARNCTQHN